MAHKLAPLIGKDTVRFTRNSYLSAFMGGNPLEETVLNIGQHYYLQYYLKLETEELSNFCREASLLKIMKFNHSIVERII